MTVISASGQEKQVYVMLDSTSQEIFISTELAAGLGMKGPVKDIILNMADGTASPRSTTQVSFSLRNSFTGDSFTVNKALVLEKLPCVQHVNPSTDGIEKYDHLRDLAHYFPALEDTQLHMIIGGNHPELITPFEVRRAAAGLPWAARCALGWVVYGTEDSSPDQLFSCCTTVMSDEALSDKLDDLLEEKYAESRHDDTQCFSVTDKKVLKAYESTVSRVDSHYSLGLPFKSDSVTMPNNFSQALVLLKGLAASFLKKPEDTLPYLDFMDDLFKSGHGRVLQPHEILGLPGKI